VESISLNRTAQTSVYKQHSEQPKVTEPKTETTEAAESVTISDEYESPQQILNQKILAALNNEITASGGTKIEDLNPADYTPDNVAKTILDFIKLGLSQVPEGDTQAREDLLNQARSGVEKGFSDARDILSGLGVLEGTIAEDIDQTYEMIMQGLDELTNTPDAG
jgi:hypothetical protein